MAKYKIYHIPDFVYPSGHIGKIGVSKGWVNQRIYKNKLKSTQPFDFWEILEEHDDIIEVSYREIELQREYGYKEDEELYYTKFKDFQKQFKGKKHTLETIEKIRKGNLGQKRTEKQRERMSKVQKTIVKDAEWIKNISEGSKGKVLSEEHKKSIGNGIRNSNKYKVGMQNRKKVNGENSGMAKLDDVNVLWIRKQYERDTDMYGKKISISRLSKVMNVSYSTIERIVKRQTWGHI